MLICHEAIFGPLSDPPGAIVYGLYRIKPTARADYSLKSSPFRQHREDRDGANRLCSYLLAYLHVGTESNHELDGNAQYSQY